MIENILCLPDLHASMQDKSTLRGYRQVVNLVIEDIIQVIQKYNITRIFGLGDLFDAGYSAEVNLALSDVIDKIMKIRNLVHGEFYEVIGNHVNQKMSSNPELYLIQPHEKYKMKDSQYIKEQKIRTPDYININGVNIYFQHWDWNEKKSSFTILDYKPAIREGKCNIALFHTTLAAPKRYCRFSKTTDDEIARAFEGLDYAICGHIHQPVEPFLIGNTQVIIPGSLTNTETGTSFHNTINIPIITINDEGEVTINYVNNFNLHTDKLEIREQQATELHSLRSRKLKDFDKDVDIETKIMGTIAWLKQRSDKTDFDIKFCEILANTPTDVNKLIDNYKQMTTVTNLNLF